MTDHWFPFNLDKIVDSIHRRRIEQTIAESFLCLDCGVDTNEIHEYYMVDDDLWLKMNPGDFGDLCVGCLEMRMGRTLMRSDFTDDLINKLGTFTQSTRLQDRLKAPCWYYA